MKSGRYNTHRRTEAPQNKKHGIVRIAKEILRIETLETRKSDSLDFHERTVWSLKAALEAAYQAGFAAKAES